MSIVCLDLQVIDKIVNIINKNKLSTLLHIHVLVEKDTGYVIELKQPPGRHTLPMDIPIYTWLYEIISYNQILNSLEYSLFYL